MTTVTLILFPLILLRADLLWNVAGSRPYLRISIEACDEAELSPLKTYVTKTEPISTVYKVVFGRGAGGWGRISFLECEPYEE